MIRKSENILISGCPRSGSSVVAAMYRELGWLIPDAEDNRKNESKPAVDFSMKTIQSIAVHRRGGGGVSEIAPWLEGLPKPWLIKNMSACLHIDAWEKAFKVANQRATLVWIERDPRLVAESFRRRRLVRRGQPTAYGYTAAEWTKRAEDAFWEWPWLKYRISHGEIRNAIQSNSITALGIALRVDPIDDNDNRDNLGKAAELFDTKRK